MEDIKELIKQKRLRWRTIVDDLTCKVCLRMDEKIIDENDPLPPLHGDLGKDRAACRCTLELID